MDQRSLLIFGFGAVAGAGLTIAMLRRSASRLLASAPAPKVVDRLAGATHDVSLETMNALKAKSSFLVPNSERRVFRVCLTGGPCSGKSSSLARLVQEATTLGFDAYSAPEMPTVVMNAGFPYPGSDGGELLAEFERQLFKMQLELENSVNTLATSRDVHARHRPSVVFFDRGLLDMKGYMPADMWNQICAQFGHTEESIKSRYDLVLHLVTAAEGALQYYTTANNAARTETPEQAIENDHRVRSAWSSHPNVKVVDNSGAGFEDKLQRSAKHLLDLIAPGSAARA